MAKKTKRQAVPLGALRPLPGGGFAVVGVKLERAMAEIAPCQESRGNPEQWAPPFRSALTAGWRLIVERLARGEEPRAQPFVPGMVWIIFDRAQGIEISWLPLERCQRINTERGWHFDALDQAVQPHHVRVLVLSRGTGAACQMPLPAAVMC